METSGIQKRLAFAHGIFDLVAGAWPVLNRRTFETATGPKVDFWLVKTVGLLIASIGSTLLFNSRKKDEVPSELKILALSSATTLAVVSFYYAYKNRISKIYYLDTLMEVAWIALWAAAMSKRRS